MSKMTEQELKALVSAEIADATAFAGGRLADERRKALDYYLGEPFGNEQEGRSQVVSTDVADTVEWILPSLLRIFTAGDEVVRFEPTGPEDEEVARQATEYVNWIFQRDNPGFLIFYTLFKDALLQKNGIAKLWWEEGETAERETYLGKTVEELQLLLADADVEPVEHSAYEDTVVAAAADGLPSEAKVTLHDVTVKRRRRRGRVRIEPVPPEEFLISRRARSIDDAPFVAHRVRRTVSELVAAGYDRELVERLSGEEESDLTLEAQSRRRLEEDAGPGSAAEIDRSRRELWVTECYIAADWDGDGIAERRKVTVAGDGNEILDNEPFDGVPFISVTPILMPHCFYGLSIADLAMDLQLIKSTILRQILDNLYLSNNGRHVISDQVNLDDMMTSRPGGIVRLKSGAMPSQGHVMPLETPLVAAAAFPVLEYLDAVREGRTGVTRYTQGLDADTLNKTAMGISQIMTAAQQRIELIARVFAETGVTDLFRKVLRLVGRHQNAPRIIRLRNRWVPMDPRSWNSEMDVSVSVGLGTGNRDQMLAHLNAILGIQAQAIQQQGGVDGPLVTLGNIYNTLAKLVENAGLKPADAFFTRPEDRPAPPPPPPVVPPMPDPRLVALQQQAKIDAARLALAERKAEAEFALDRAKLEAEMALKRDELMAVMALKREELLMREGSGDVTAAAAAAAADGGEARP
jgi:hypothetical protein